jgi:lipopolysaccharide biosynthesis glycosyltransferase
MNLEALRNDGFFDKAQILYPKIESQITWADQCLINKCAEGRKIVLDAKWNRQIFSSQTTESDFINLVSADTSAIFHFVGSVKPWQDWCNPSIARYWWKIANELRIEGLEPTPITSVSHLLELANVHHLNGNFEVSSSIKSHVIKAMTDHLQKTVSIGVK